MENDFSSAFMSNDEIEKEMDKFINGIKDEVENDEEKVTVINMDRYNQIKFAYAVLRYLVSNCPENNDINISYKLHEPFKTMGSISIEGKILGFDKPEWFARIAEFANSTEVYPLAKNRVRVTFTFHGLTAPVE